MSKQLTLIICFGINLVLFRKILFAKRVCSSIVISQARNFSILPLQFLWMPFSRVSKRPRVLRPEITEAKRSEYSFQIPLVVTSEDTALCPFCAFSTFTTDSACVCGLTRHQKCSEYCCCELVTFQIRICEFESDLMNQVVCIKEGFVYSAKNGKQLAPVDIFQEFPFRSPLNFFSLKDGFLFHHFASDDKRAKSIICRYYKRMLKRGFEKLDRQDIIQTLFKQCSKPHIYEYERPFGFHLELYPFQKQVVGWMLQQENCPEEFSLPIYLESQPLFDEGKASLSIEKPLLNIVEEAFVTEKEFRLCHGGILADEMGLGKTVEMLCVICSNRMKSTLILCPSAIISQWIEEIEAHTDLSVVDYKGESTVFDKFDVIICSTKRLAKEFNYFSQNHKVLRGRQIVPKGSLLEKYKWDRIVLDESQEVVGNGKSKASKMAQYIKAKYRWAISGTPFVKNDMADIRGYMHFLGIFPDSKHWVTPSLEFLSKFMIRNSKETVQNQVQIPNLIFKTHFLNFSQIEKYEYDLLKKSEIDLKSKFEKMRFACVYLGERNRDASTLEMILEDRIKENLNELFSLERKRLKLNVSLALVYETEKKYFDALQIYDKNLSRIEKLKKGQIYPKSGHFDERLIDECLHQTLFSKASLLLESEGKSAADSFFDQAEEVRARLMQRVEILVKDQTNEVNEIASKIHARMEASEFVSRHMLQLTDRKEILDFLNRPLHEDYALDAERESLGHKKFTLYKEKRNFQGEIGVVIEKEKRIMMRAFNARIQYYSQLQSLSDNVTVPEIKPGDENHLKSKLNDNERSRCYLESLRKYLLSMQLSDSENCPVCCDSIENGVITPCNHVGCEDCFNAWIRKAKNCPMCKAKSTVQDLKKIRQSLKGPKYSTKIDAILKLVEEKSSDSKIVIFSHWDFLLDRISRELSEMEIPFARPKELSSFKKTVNVLLLHAKQQSSGLTLVCAQHLILCEPSTCIELELQAIARIHRIGQRENATVHRFVVRSSVEERILLGRNEAELGGKLLLKESDLESQDILKYIENTVEIAPAET